MTITEAKWDNLVRAGQPCQLTYINWKSGKETGVDKTAHPPFCAGCGGTGKVLLLPFLSEVCLRCDGRGNTGSGWVFADGLHECRECHGTGRAPKPIDGFLLIAEMQKIGFEPQIGTQLNPEGKIECVWWFVKQTELFSGFNSNLEVPVENDHETACVEAAWKAVETKCGKHLSI